MIPALAERIQELRSALAGMETTSDLKRQVELLRELGWRLAQAQETAGALAATEEALRVLTEAGLEHSPEGAILRLDLADRTFAENRFEEALTRYQSAAAELEHTHGAESKAFWAARERLGITARTVGDFALARTELEASLSHRRSGLEKDPAAAPDLLSVLLELGRLERATGRLDRASAIVAEAADLAQKLGDHALLADVFQELGALATRQRELSHAVNFHQLAHRIRSARLGAAHPTTLHSLTALGEVYALSGRLEEARDILEEARKHGTQAALDRTLCETILAGVLFRQGKPGQSQAGFDTAAAQFASMNHRQIALASRDAVFAAAKAGDWPKAAQHAHASINAALKLWTNVLRYGSEADRLAWQAITDVVSACACVASHDLQPIERALFQFKGAVADSMAADWPQFATDGEASQLGAARTALRAVELSSRPGEPELARARAAVEQLESRLTANRVLRDPAAPEHSFEEVRAAIGLNRVLVDFVRFQSPGADFRFRARYGALITSTGFGSRWLDLGPAEGVDGIDARIATLNEALRSRLLPSDAEFVGHASAVHAALWEPVREHLPPQVDEILVVPDGQLNLVSWATLWTGTRLLGEQVRFRYLSSCRRLLNPALETGTGTQGLIVADPDFDCATAGGALNVAVRVGRRAMDWLGLRGGTGLPEAYSRLPGSRLEGERIERLWRDHGLPEVLHLRDEGATKERLEQIRRPRFVHLATHGQYVEGAALPPNPMLRSWLALAGANRTLACWREGTLQDDLNDGLLRADEIRLLDLAGTELVALSACDSGAGAIRVGEGVFGLRRAFHEAGVRHLLLTLWPVSDLQTAEFMPQFYRQVLSGGDPVRALHEVQATALESSRLANGPVLAARLYGGFVMSA